MYAIAVLTASLYLSMTITYHFISSVIDTSKVKYVKGIWSLIKTTLLIATAFIIFYLVIDHFLFHKLYRESFKEPAYQPVAPAPYQE